MIKHLLDHLMIVAVAALFSVGLGVLLGVLSCRRRLAGRVILAVCDVIQTVPALALLAILMILFGLGNNTVIIGLVLYSLLPIARNTYTGICAVEPHIIDAARGMGMSATQRLFKVELPLAFPMIFSGVKIAVVASIGTAVIGVLIGSGGLGYPIYRGIQTQNTALILSGAAPAVLLAVLFDAGMGRLERLLTKKKINTATGKEKKGWEKGVSAH